LRIRAIVSAQKLFHFGSLRRDFENNAQGAESNHRHEYFQTWSLRGHRRDFHTENRFL